MQNIIVARNWNDKIPRTFLRNPKNNGGISNWRGCGEKELDKRKQGAH